MNKKLQHFYDEFKTPWMQLFYRLVWAQLPELSGARVLDFGAGFGWTANHLAASNQVLALEPNSEMVAQRQTDNAYEMRIGGLEALRQLPSHSYELIICHNVLEYTKEAERAAILEEFVRLLSPTGQISLVKHNFPGRIMQNVVFENQLDEAQELLEGRGTHRAVSFGQVNYYTLPEALGSLPLKVEKLYGVRTFFGMQPNEAKTVPDWADRMFEIERKVEERPEYNAVAFFHHLLLRKDSQND